MKPAPLFKTVYNGGNSKLGIGTPYTLSSQSTCPPSCPITVECYHKTAFYMQKQWNAVDSDGVSFDNLLDWIRWLPARTFWRMNVAGDLPGYNESTKLGNTMLSQLVEASRGRQGFSYTHHLWRYRDATGHMRYLTKRIEAWRIATALGFTVNVSCETETQADAAVALGLRAVCIAPSTETRAHWLSPDGNHMVLCPHSRFKALKHPHPPTCRQCKLCHARPQNVVIVFPAHGSKKKQLDALLIELNS